MRLMTKLWGKYYYIYIKCPSVRPSKIIIIVLIFMHSQDTITYMYFGILVCLLIYTVVPPQWQTILYLKVTKAQTNTKTGNKHVYFALKCHNFKARYVACCITNFRVFFRMSIVKHLWLLDLTSYIIKKWIVVQSNTK